MKISKLALALVMLMTFSLSVSAQTVDEIIDNYLENTGGKEAWTTVEGLKMKGKVQIPSQGLDLPIAGVQLKDGRQISSAEFQGQTFVQQAYDGETAWGTNFMTMKAEKSDSEATENLKRSFAEFPDPFLNYKEKGFEAELVGNETVDGVETFKVKLTKKPVMVDGKEEENVVYYFFDPENFVPIMQESVAKTGPAKGAKTQSFFSDYEEFGGFYFPLTTEVKANGQVFQTVTMETIEVNPEVDEAMFAMPEVVETEEKK